MKLESLSISRPWMYRPGNKDPLPYQGTVTFDAPTGEIKLKLTDDISRRIIAACAEEIMQAATVQADALRLAAGASSGLMIEHQTEAAE